MNKEYKVVSVEEGALGTIFFGASKLPLRRMETVLNDYANEGWSLDFQLVELRRMLLFWTRESVVMTLSRARS